VVVAPGTRVGEAIAVIDAGQLGLALVCDGAGRLLGIVTDVDIRKGLLRGMRLEDAVETIMCEHPSVAEPATARAELLALMHRTGIRQVPIVDLDGRVLGVEILKDLTAAPLRDTEVVIMAGGRGRRLRPLTDTLPKPMLPIGGRPLLEILVERLREQGFTRLTIAVHYKGDVIEEHFGGGERWGVRIRYVREAEERGTAGGLFLLDPRPERPFIVINGDLLTELNFERLADYHAAHGGDLTVCVKEYRIEVPFGVVDLAGEQIVDIREKPGALFHVNAGIYVLEPHVLDRVDAGGPLDMPDLVRALLGAGARVGCFPLREKWFDIGTQADYRRAAEAFEGARE
jgi:dTDP-glucose pyrophosphorylase